MKDPLLRALIYLWVILYALSAYTLIFGVIFVKNFVNSKLESVAIGLMLVSGILIIILFLIFVTKEIFR